MSKEKMIHLLSTFLIGVFVATSVFADTPATDEARIIDAIKTMYVAATNDDLALFNTVAASDFYAFDGGRRFTGDSLMEFIKNLHAAGSIAWITYVNRGSVEDKSGKKDLTWLESAVLRKDAGTWRIHFFHSTRAP